jgi:hypothetical protein
VKEFEVGEKWWEEDQERITPGRTSKWLYFNLHVGTAGDGLISYNRKSR